MIRKKSQISQLELHKVYTEQNLNANPLVTHCSDNKKTAKLFVKSLLNPQREAGTLTDPVQLGRLIDHINTKSLIKNGFGSILGCKNTRFLISPNNGLERSTQIQIAIQHNQANQGINKYKKVTIPQEEMDLRRQVQSDLKNAIALTSASDITPTKPTKNKIITRVDTPITIKDNDDKPRTSILPSLEEETKPVKHVHFHRSTK